MMGGKDIRGACYINCALANRRVCVLYLNWLRLELCCSCGLVDYYILHFVYK